MMPNCIRELGRRGAVLAALAVVAGCSVTDSEAPGQPRFDLAPGPVFTRGAKMDLAGTAEYGASLVLTRAPSFATAPAAITADPWAGTFRFRDVPLEAGKNVFTLVATDADNNASEAATLEVNFEDAPSELRLTLSTTLVTAGTTGGRGTLDAVAELLGAEQGYPVAGREVTFAVQDVAAKEIKATTDGRGIATATFTGLATAGQGKVTAAAAGKQVERSFLVTGGLASTLVLKLAPAGGTAAGSDALEIAAGGEVVAQVTVKDAGDNPVDAPVTLYTDAPGAFVEGRKLTHLVKAGAWRVVAAVNGAATDAPLGVSDAASLTVTAAAAAAVDLAAPATAQAGTAAPWTVTLADAYGNETAPGSSQTLAVTSGDAEATVSMTEKTALFRTAGPQTLRAALTDGTNTISAVRTVVVAPGAPTEVTLALQATDQKPETPELDVKAAENASLTVVAAARDAFGNAGAAPVVLTTTAPATFEGSVLRGLKQAGRYRVRAGAADAPVDAATDFNVVAGDAASMVLVLAAPAATAGQAVRFTAALADAWGNPTEEAVAVTVDGLTDATAVNAAAGTVTIRQAGTWTVRAAPTAGGCGTPATRCATAPLVVAAAAPASVTVSVGPQNTVRAGENPTFTATALDAFANAVPNAPLQFFVVAQAGTVVTGPGPFASAGKIYNLTKPGRYLCLAQVAGTSITNDLADPEATLVVTAADAAALDLVLGRNSVEAGSPLDFRAEVRDAWGNPVAATATVTVGRTGDSNPPAVLSPWMAGAPGSYTMSATLTVPGTPPTVLSDVELFTVVAAADLAPPALVFSRPAAEPTVGAWPPPGQVSPGCSGNPNGDTVSLTVTDASLVERVWVSGGGLLTSAVAQPALAFPESPVAVNLAVCDAITDARGEVIVDAAAQDSRGNFARASASWCLDPDANTDGQPDYLAYLPANPPASRCRIYKDPGTATTHVRALAANGRGNLVVAREGAAGAALVQRFVRAGGPYGLGAAHPLATNGNTWKYPLGVAAAGSTSLASAIDGASDTALVRTRDVFSDGATDDLFVKTASTSGRFAGVALAADGALWAVWHARTETDRTGSVYRFPGALDLSTSHTSLPAANCLSATGACLAVASTAARLVGLCPAAAPDVFFVYGIKGSGASAKAAVYELSAGALAEKWVDADSGREIGGCALTTQGLALAMKGATAGSGQVLLLDLGPARTLTPLLSHWAAGSGLDRPMGVALHQGRLFVGVNDATTFAGSLVRFAREGGF